jgi:hypothetical protein
MRKDDSLEIGQEKFSCLDDKPALQKVSAGSIDLFKVARCVLARFVAVPVLEITARACNAWLFTMAR